MKRTIKKTVLFIKAFDKKENKIVEDEFTTMETNQKKIEKAINKIADTNNLVIIEILSQNVVKETYEMDDITFFKYAKIVK
jgi:nucleoside-triphosphatase THEP1